MNTTKLYVTKDNDANKYNDRIFQAPNDTVAKRIIKNALDNDKNFKHDAKSYDLFCLGEYDWENGRITTDCQDKVCAVSELITEE